MRVGRERDRGRDRERERERERETSSPLPSAAPSSPSLRFGCMGASLAVSCTGGVKLQGALVGRVGQGARKEQGGSTKKAKKCF
jgi:hypothetical protein